MFACQIAWSGRRCTAPLQKRPRVTALAQAPPDTRQQRGPRTGAGRRVRLRVLGPGRQGPRRTHAGCRSGRAPARRPARRPPAAAAAAAQRHLPSSPAPPAQAMRCARSAPSGAHAASAPPPPSPGASRKLARSARAPHAQPACSACPRAACSGARAARGRCADRWRRAARAHARSPQRCSRRAPLCVRGALSGDTVCRAPFAARREAARPPCMQWTQ